MPISPEWRPFASGALRITLIVVIGHITTRVGAAVINRLWSGYSTRAKDAHRVHTMATLLRSVLRYGVDFVAFVSILDVFEINTSSVLAGAGIIGLAIGFGAQNFVKDLIAGLFIIFEDQFAVGEYVNIAGVSGTVEDVGLRVTRVRTASGELHSIPNGAIDRSANMSRGYSLAMVDIPVATDEKIGIVTQVLSRVVDEVRRNEPLIREGPELLGPVGISEVGVTFRIIARTEPLAHWAIERKIRALVKQAFENEGVRLPSLLAVRREE